LKKKKEDVNPIQLQTNTIAYTTQLPNHPQIQEQVLLLPNYFTPPPQVQQLQPYFAPPQVQQPQLIFPSIPPPVPTIPPPVPTIPLVPTVPLVPTIPPAPPVTQTDGVGQNQTDSAYPLLKAMLDRRLGRVPVRPPPTPMSLEGLVSMYEAFEIQQKSERSSLFGRM